MTLPKSSAGYYQIAAHHFVSLAPGAECSNTSRPCEGIRALTDLMDYAAIAKQGDQGVSHWGVVTDQEVAELKQARAEYLERMARVSVY